jgi:hypothetical protein
MKLRRALIVAAVALSMAPVARSGHEQSVYPSYYPHEIEIRALAPAPAAELLRAESCTRTLVVCRPWRPAMAPQP